MERLAVVTVADVQRVARAYLKPSRRNVGRYVPIAGAEIVQEVADE
jgi:predicted Zn-dependent peptidase